MNKYLLPNKLFVVCLFLFCLCQSALAVIGEVPRSNERIVIDGKINDAEWSSALKVDLKYETRPAENAPASVKTTAYLLEDGNQLLIAFKAYDPNPEQIRAFLRDRDSLYEDDFVGIAIDTFNDNKRAFEFFVNPLGAQADLIQDDVLQREDDSWNTIWQSKANITEQGFEVEMAIPFGSLRFADNSDNKIWGIDLIRMYPRQVRRRLSNNAQDREKSCYLCQISKVSGFAGIEASSNMMLTPTMTAVASEERETDIGSVWTDEEADPEFGLDFQWGITPNNVLNTTLNPDFSQVESDAAQLNVNEQFSLFFPERRTFFLEGADYFDSMMRVVHTRNIGDPDFGVKYTGKNDAHTTGLIVANDTSSNFLIPGNLSSSVANIDQESNNTIGRYRYDFAEGSSMGALLTSRVADGYSNTVAGMDGKYQMTEQDRVRYQIMISDTENPQEVQDEFELAEEQQGSAVNLRYEHITRNGTIYAGYDNFHEDFRADMGFISRVNYDFWVLGFDRKLFPDEETWWTELGFHSDIDITHDQDGQLLEKEKEATIWLDGPMQSVLEVGATRRERFYEGVLYSENIYDNYMHIKPFGGVTLGVYQRWGDDIDFSNNRQGNSFLSEPFINLNIGQHLSFDYNHLFQKFNVLGERLFTARIHDFRVTYQFNDRHYLRLTVQESRIDRNLSLYNEPEDFDADARDVGKQLLYSYKVNPQTLVFVGYSDSALDDDEQVELYQVARSLFAKFSYALQL